MELSHHLQYTLQLYCFNINIKDPPLFPKIFPENFIDGINPPKTPVKMSYRGGYGRGDPHHRGAKGVCHPV